MLTALLFGFYIAESFPKEIAVAWLVAASMYNVLGLAIPRLKDARLSPWLLLLFLVPIGNLVLQIVLFVAPTKAT